MKPLINPSRVSYNIDICHSLEEAFAKKAELEAKGFWVKSIRGPSNKKEAAQGRALPRYVVEHWVMKRKKKEACR
jgi:hypothetical protein